MQASKVCLILLLAFISASSKILEVASITTFGGCQMMEADKNNAKAKGGHARAESLTDNERSQIAKKAAETRWNALQSLPKATHGDPDHPLKIGGIEIPCYVLDTGTRVITHRGLQTSLGMPISGGAQKTASIFTALESKGLEIKDSACAFPTPLSFALLLVGAVHSVTTLLSWRIFATLSLRLGSALISERSRPENRRTM